MPIRPDLKHFYGPEWENVSRRIRYDRAGGRCECTGQCGLAHAGRCQKRNDEPIEPCEVCRLTRTCSRCVSAVTFATTAASTLPTPRPRELASGAKTMPALAKAISSRWASRRSSTTAVILDEIEHDLRQFQP